MHRLHCRSCSPTYATALLMWSSCTRWIGSRAPPRMSPSLLSSSEPRDLLCLRNAAVQYLDINVMVDLLQNLDIGDANARLERDAYKHLVSDQRAVVAS